MRRRPLTLVALLLLGLLPACGSDGPTRAQAGTTTSTVAEVQPGSDDDGPADPCAPWRAFLDDGDRAHVEDLLAGQPTDEVAEAARQLLANFEPETVEGQDAHEAAVDVITAALDCDPAADPVLEAAAEAYLAGPDACGGAAAPLEDGGLDRAFVVTEQAGTTVVSITCELYAYQMGYELHRWDGASLSRLDVQQWVDGALVHDPMVVGFSHLEGDGRIANDYRGRGVGDCGTYQAWTLEGARLVLDEARAKEGCDDQLPQPDTWPVVYRR